MRILICLSTSLQSIEFNLSFVEENLGKHDEQLQ